jgi:hypothetical protein
MPTEQPPADNGTDPEEITAQVDYMSAVELKVGDGLDPATYGPDGLVTEEVVTAVYPDDFEKPAKEKEEDEDDYKKRIKAAQKESDGVRMAKVKIVHERIVEKDVQCLAMLQSWISPTSTIKESPLLPGERVVFTLPVVGFLGGPAGVDGIVGECNLMLTQFPSTEKEVTDTLGNTRKVVEEGKYRMHYLVQSGSAKMNFMEDVSSSTLETSSTKKSGSPLKGKTTSASRMEQDEALVLYRLEHGMYGHYSIMNVDGEVFHAHSEWVATAQLSSAFEASEKTKSFTFAKEKDCCEDCCKCKCTCVACCACECIEISCCKAKAEASVTESKKSSKLEGSCELTPSLERYLQKFEKTETDGVVAPKSLGMEREIKGEQVDQTLTRKLNTLHLVCRTADSVWNQENLESIVAVIEPSVPIVDVMRAASTLQNLIPKTPAYVNTDMDQSGWIKPQGFPGWSGGTGGGNVSGKGSTGASSFNAEVAAGNCCFCFQKKSEAKIKAEEKKKAKKKNKAKQSKEEDA